MFLPYSFDILHDRRPWLAYVLIPLLVIFGITYMGTLDAPYLGWGDTFDGAPIQPMLPLDGYIHITPVIGLIYLAVSAFYAWVFGTAVCSKIGNLMFLLLLVGLLFPLHIVWSNRDSHGFLPMSCLIEWLLGMCLFYWPMNPVDCFVLVPMRNTFPISAWWMVVFWFGFDLILALMYELRDSLVLSPLSLIGGVLFAGFLQWIRLAVMDPDDRTLWQILRRQPEPDHTVNDLWVTRKQKKKPKDTEPDLPLPAHKPSSQENDNRQILCQCGKLISLPRTFDGKGIQCPHCKHPLQSV